MIESAEWMPETMPGQMKMIKAVIDGREWYVPDDMENRDRQDIEEWTKAGNQIAPAATPEGS
jgi:hypothetical protein